MRRRQVVCRRRARNGRRDGWWRRYGDAQLAQLMEEALAGSPDLAGRGGPAAHRGRLRPARRRRAASRRSTPSRRPTCRSSARTGRCRRRPCPNGWNDSGAAGLGLLARPRPVGQEPRRVPRRRRRRRCRALRTRRSAAGPDHRHRFDLCRSGVALCAARQPRVGARDPHADGEAGHASGRDRPRYAGRAEAGRSAHVAGSRRHRRRRTRRSR